MKTVLRSEAHGGGALALAASSSRLRGLAVVSSECSRREAAAATSSIAPRKAASLAFEGLLKPLILRTNCSEAAWISSSVTGGSKLKRILMLRHMRITSGSHSVELRPTGQPRAAIPTYFFLAYAILNQIEKGAVHAGIDGEFRMKRCRHRSSLPHGHGI